MKAELALDVPIVNLGFSGSGRMEFEMSEHLAAIKTALKGK